MRRYIAGTLSPLLTCCLQVCIYQHRVPRLKTEVAVHRAHESMCVGINTASRQRFGYVAQYRLESSVSNAVTSLGSR